MKIIEKNLLFIGKTWLVFMGSAFSILSIVLSFLTWDDMGVSKTCNKIMIFVIMVLCTLVLAAIWICLLKRKKIIWRNGSGEVIVCYGDIMRIAFPKRFKKKSIVVIPVNTCFDTQVDEDISKCNKPLVSPKTIHGQWIKNMIAHGVSKENIDSLINEYIDLKGIKPIEEFSREQKERGKIKNYSNGTTVILEGKNGITFFLLALSEFDKNNKAESSKESIIECIQNLLEFYDNNGQGFNIYVTLLGTGLSRSGMSHEDSLKTIKSVFQLYSDKIHGKFNIVIYQGDKTKVSIFD